MTRLVDLILATLTAVLVGAFFVLLILEYFTASKIWHLLY